MKTARYAALGMLLGAAGAWAGPPFQTDDPEPLPQGHFEFYTFANADGTKVEMDTFGPALELNYGATDNLFLHLIVPAASALPANNPAYAPLSFGPNAFGIGDTEIGIKYRYVHERKDLPEIGTFTMIELPTGSYPRGLGVGTLWFRLPLWIQKSWGPWTTYGGGGETLITGKAAGYSDFPFAGWLVQRDLNRKLTLGTEVFYHGAEGEASPQYRPATMVDFGGYYKFHGDESFQVLFAYGHTVAGLAENYAYLGLYWTWGRKGTDTQAPPPDFARLAPHGPGGNFYEY